MALSLVVLSSLLTAPVPAPVVIEGVVTEQSSRWEDGIIVTRSIVEVTNVLTGSAPAKVQVRHLGGAVDGLGQWWSGGVWLVPGERVRLDLAPSGAEMTVVGGETGVHQLGAGTERYVRTTTASAMPECPQQMKYPLFWNVVTIPYVIDSAGSDDIRPPEPAFAAIRASFATWENIDRSYISFQDNGLVDNVKIGYEKSGPNSNAVKFIEEDWTRDFRALAITLATFDCNSGEIVDADIILNGEDAVFTTNPAVDVTKNDIQNTVTHEVGHFIGFDHNTDPESTMYSDAAPGETKKRDLTQDDIQGAIDVYEVGHEPEPAGCCSGAGHPGSPLALGALVGLVALRRRRARA